jgi:hypothetical protein
MPVTAPLRSIHCVGDECRPCCVAHIANAGTIRQATYLYLTTASDGSCGVVSILCTDILASRVDKAKSVNVADIDANAIHSIRPVCCA